MRRFGILLASATCAAGALVGGAPASAGTDDSASAEPKQGVTYSGRTDALSVRLTVLAPTPDGNTQMLGRVRLECGDVRGDRAVAESIPLVVGDDGTYTLDVKESEVGGGTFEVEIHIEGRFTGEDSTSASYSYSLYDEDDDGNTDSCQDRGDLELEAGRADPGLERVEVAIPLETAAAVDDEDEEYLGGPIVASADAVFASIGDTLSDGPDVSDLFRIDPTTNQVTAHQQVTVDIGALVAAGSSLWAIDADNGTIIPIDTTSLALGSPIQIAPPRDPAADDDFALFPSGAVVDGSLWLSATRDQELVRADAATGAVQARVPIDAHPHGISAAAGGLFVETQSRTLFGAPSGRTPKTNVIRRIDPATGETLQQSTAYFDGSLGTLLATEDGVVVSLTSGAPSTPDQLLSLDPETLETDATAKLQYPAAAAPPGVWTVTTAKVLNGLDADLEREVAVPHVAGDGGDAGVGFDALWVYSPTQRSMYRISTT